MALSEGAVAQLGEHLLCKQGVVGSIPISSTSDGVSEMRRQKQAEAFAPGFLAGPSGSDVWSCSLTIGKK